MLSGYLSALTSDLCQDKSTYETYEIKKQISLKSINEYLILFLITLMNHIHLQQFLTLWKYPQQNDHTLIFDYVQLFGWFWLAFELKYASSAF